MSLAREEIEILIHDIHDFFTDWIGGRCPGDAKTLKTRALDRISDDFVAVFPAGRKSGKSDFERSMSGSYGSSPDFRIRISDMSVPHLGNGLAIVIYREWQRGAKNSDEPENGRITTMVVGPRLSGDGLEILHVHETWLPREEVEKADFDF